MAVKPEIITTSSLQWQITRGSYDSVKFGVRGSVHFRIVYVNWLWFSFQPCSRFYSPRDSTLFEVEFERGEGVDL